MKSMTGYGKGVAAADGLELTIEIKSVNNRFLEINNRIPKLFVAYDSYIRGLISTRLSRGSVDVYYNYRVDGSSENSVGVDTDLARRYITAAEKIAQCGVPNDLTASTVMRLPDVLTGSDPEIPEKSKKHLCETAVLDAIDTLIAARSREGDALGRDIGVILDGIRDRMQKISVRAPELVKDYETRLRAHMSETLKEVPIDEERVLNEVALFIDRADTNEEIQRLNAHIQAFGALVSQEGAPVGRQMDFLTQELIREANTLGSKCGDLETTNLVLELKNEVEKLKEQSRNAE